MSDPVVKELIEAITADAVPADDPRQDSNAAVEEWDARHNPGGRNNIHNATVAAAKLFASWLRHFARDRKAGQ